MGNGKVIARQMFGLHGRKQQGYEGNIQTRGGLMYYQHDGLGNVMDVTDRIGDTGATRFILQLGSPTSTSG